VRIPLRPPLENNKFFNISKSDLHSFLNKDMTSKNYEEILMLKKLMGQASLCILTLTLFLPTAFADNKGFAVILVDMQEGFYDRGGVRGTNGLQTLVNKQIELLNWAVREDVPVIVFEYESFGATDSQLMDALKGHKYK